MVKKIKRKDTTNINSFEVFNIVNNNKWLKNRLSVLDKEISNIFYQLSENNLSIAIHIDRIVKQNINPDTLSLRFKQWILTPEELELMCMFQILPDNSEVGINETHKVEPEIKTPKIEIVQG